MVGRPILVGRLLADQDEGEAPPHASRGEQPAVMVAALRNHDQVGPPTQPEIEIEKDRLIAEGQG